MKKLMKANWVMKLRVNMHNKIYMEVTKKPANTKMLKTDDQQHERVKEVKYLGKTLTEENDRSTEIKEQIIMANKTSGGLKKQLTSLNLNIRLNVCNIKSL